VPEVRQQECGTGSDRIFRRWKQEELKAATVLIGFVLA
jgi:hypothetical protein